MNELSVRAALGVAVVSLLASVSQQAHARDPGLNQPGAVGNRGVADPTRSPVMVVVTVAFSVVILLIVDLDRPGEGWINVSQDAMLDLREALRTPR